MRRRFVLKDFIGAFITERNESLFKADIIQNHTDIYERIAGKSVLVIGGAGTIGASFIKAILPFNPGELVVVDNNENGLAELVRDLRSSLVYNIPAKFVTYPMSISSSVFQKVLASRHFQIVANFAAHKHVRSEKDQFSVEAMITNNVISAYKLMELLDKKPPEHFFCVSTDKAANPVNIMGASKKLMEEVIFNFDAVPVTTARFANVAFSNGSLPAGFLERISKFQTISAPQDVKRYFLSPEESGEICLLACVLGKPGEIFFPRLESSSMKTFSQIAINLLEEQGYNVVRCTSEEEAKHLSDDLAAGGNNYPVLFFDSDTTGEKPHEEFYTVDEIVDLHRFQQLGIIRSSPRMNGDLKAFIGELELLFQQENYKKSEVVELLESVVPGFRHAETGKYLDQKM